MDEQNVVVDAGEALALAETTVTTTTNEESQDTLKNLKTVQQDESTNNQSAQEWGEDEGEDDEWEDKKKFDAPKPESGEWEDDEEDDANKKKVEDEEEDSDEEDDDEDETESDIAYIKNNPEAILKLIQELQENSFQNKWKKKFELVQSELQELENNYKELQKQKYADKYDDANLPVLEEKRPFWRAQNKFYDNPENEANRQAYVRRLKEELEDIEHSGKVVSIDEKETSKPEPKPAESYNSLGRVWIQIKQPRR